MRFTRRRMLAVGSCGLLRRILGATFEVDRLLDADSPGSRLELRKYTATATVMLFSIPLVSKSAVGSGYAVVEDAGRTLSIQFGAGSYPDSARGLNRLGFIQEAVVEERPGVSAECAWLAFMTTSQEKNLEQAKKAMEASGSLIPYIASQGCGKDGRFRSRVDRLEFPSKFTWRDVAELIQKARAGMTALQVNDGAAAIGAERPATFLYLVRRGILDTSPRTTGSLIFNSREFQLDTEKEQDSSLTPHFSERNLVPSGASVMRLSATITERHTGIKTPFRLWYEAGSEHSLPLRFEYQAKSYLRLTFEADPKANAPPVHFAFRSSKDNG